MRTMKHARITASLIAFVCLASPLAWSAEETEGAEIGTEPAAAEEAPAVEDSANADEAALSEEASPALGSSAADDARLEHAEPVPAVPSLQRQRGPEPALVPASPAPVLENPADFARRVRQARALAEQQRKARSVDVVPDGLTPAELEIRAAERNVAIYDQQIDTGAGTPAIEAYRKYALKTLTELRRKYLAKRWADVLAQPEASRQLREHAQRMAELKRIRHLASVKSYSGIAHQAEALMEHEKARFEKSMLALRGPTTAANEPAPATVARAGADSR